MRRRHRRPQRCRIHPKAAALRPRRATTICCSPHAPPPHLWTRVSSRRSLFWSTKVILFSIVVTVSDVCLAAGPAPVVGLSRGWRWWQVIAAQAAAETRLQDHHCSAIWHHPAMSVGWPPTFCSFMVITGALAVRVECILVAQWSVF